MIFSFKDLEQDLRRKSRGCITVLVSALVCVAGCVSTEQAQPDTPDSEDEKAEGASDLDQADSQDEDSAKEPEAQGHLRVRTLYSVDGPEADRALYRVRTPDGEEVRRPTRSTSFDLDPGNYELSVTVGAATATAAAEVRSEERTELDLILEAGVLQLKTFLAEGKDEASKPMYRILSKEEDIQGGRETVVQATRSSSFTLPQGTYIARVSEGNASVDKEVTIEAGERHEVEVFLDAGLVVGKAVQEDGSEVERALWRVLSAEEDIRGSRETVAPATRSSSFLLPAGKYLLRVTVGDRSVEEVVTVEAGERHEIELKFGGEE